MAIRPIRLYPDPVLRRECVPVETFDDELRRLVSDMSDTMYAAPGIGLAAPQIGIERQVAIVDVTAGEGGRDLHVLINPEIVAEEGDWIESEGCLSIPEIADKVVRPMRIAVEARDTKGRPFELDAEEWLARAICHEIDHLHGVLFTDRVRGLRKQRVRRQLRRLVREAEQAQQRSVAGILR